MKFLADFYLRKTRMPSLCKQRYNARPSPVNQVHSGLHQCHYHHSYCGTLSVSGSSQGIVFLTLKVVFFWVNQVHEHKGNSNIFKEHCTDDARLTFAHSNFNCNVNCLLNTYFLFNFLKKFQRIYTQFRNRSVPKAT